jgi:multisubunit Na+/H+ antiporter MnhG subunit
LIGVAGNLPPSARAATLGVAAGQFFALSAVLTKLTTDDLLHRGVGATALDWPGYALALTTVFGLLLEQSAFASGPLPSALTAMTIVNPVASYLIGVLAADVAAPNGAGSLAAVGLSGLFLVIGIVTLAHSPSVREVAETPGQATAETLVAADSVR